MIARRDSGVTFWVRIFANTGGVLVQPGGGGTGEPGDIGAAPIGGG